MNVEAAVRLSGFHVDVPLNRLEVIPVVITNHQFGVGTSHQGIPIIDRVALLAFFNNVYCHRVQLKDDKVLDPGDQVRFWNTPGEASRMLKQYLVCPPQVEFGSSLFCVGNISQAGERRTLCYGQGRSRHNSLRSAFGTYSVSSLTFATRSE